MVEITSFAEAVGTNGKASQAFCIRPNAHRRSARLADVLHVLLHLAHADAPVTPEVLAAAMRTNPVVLRRLMAGLREAGLITSERGHGGGWVMAAPLESVTLHDVHMALGAPALVSLGFREDRPECLVAEVVNESLRTAMEQAEASLQAHLDGITLAELSRGFDSRPRSTLRSGSVLVHSGPARRTATTPGPQFGSLPA